MMKLNFPFKVSSSGRSAQASQEEHIQQMIEQLLFTTPGERVNRPDFGTGLKSALFAPINDEMTTIIQSAVQGELQQQLGHLVQVQEVHVESEDTTVKVLVRYLISSSQQNQVVQFEQGLT